MVRFTHPRLDDVPLAGVLHALAEPVRLAIVKRLEMDRAAGGSGLPCGVGAGSGIAPATASNHYAVLRSAGLVHARKEGVQVIHELRRSEIDQRFPGLLDAVLLAAGNSPRVARANSAIAASKVSHSSTGLMPACKSGT